MNIKYWLLLEAAAILFAFCFKSGSSSFSNSISFNNQTQDILYINFRGQIITVHAGQTSNVEKIPQGTDDFATTFSILASATCSSSQGNITGTFAIRTNTKFLIYFTSTLINGA